MGFLGKMTRYRGGNVCCAVRCKNSTWKDGLSFFRVPKDYLRGKLWLERAGRTDLLTLDPVKWSKSYRLCSRHFLPSQFSCSGRLMWNATPSIFPQNSSCGPLFPKPEPDDPGDPRCDRIECTRDSKDSEQLKQQCGSKKDLLDARKPSSEVIQRVVYCVVDQSALRGDYMEALKKADKDPLDLSENVIKVEREDSNETSFSEVNGSGIVRDILIPVKSEFGDYSSEMERNPVYITPDLSTEERTSNEELLISGSELVSSTADCRHGIPQINKDSAHINHNTLSADSLVPKCFNDGRVSPRMDRGNGVNGSFPNSSQVLMCGVCGGCFSQTEDIEFHMGSHFVEALFICVSCKRGFHLKDSLDQHKCNLRVE